MAIRKRSAVLNRLAGKNLVFSGKFDHGTEDSLKAMACAQRGTVREDLDAKTDYLVVADLSAGKTIQKKALALNAKGAAIQVIDADAFKKLAEPTEEEILAMLRAGECEAYAKMRGPTYGYISVQSPKYAFYSEDLSEANLKKAELGDFQFCGCRFVGTELEYAHIGSATDCDFSKAVGGASRFGDVPRCRFIKAKLNGAYFEGDFSGADFTEASLESASFNGNSYYGHGRSKKTAPTGTIFGKAKLTSANFNDVNLKSPDFRDAELTKATLSQCVIDSGIFRSARLRDATMAGCKFPCADLTDADLTGANLAGADLSNANLSGANLKNTNLRGTKLDGVDLSKTKNYDPSKIKSGSVGPALTELDSVNSQAKRIKVTFRLRSSNGEDQGQAGIDSSGLKWGWGIQSPVAPVSLRFPSRRQLKFSDAMIELANSVGHFQVCFDTLEVSSTKSPMGGKQLRDLLLQGIAEAFAQEIPPAAELAAAAKKQREAKREAGAAERERREKQKAEAAKEKEKAKKQIAKKIEKAVGKVSDVGSFLQALELRIEKPKIDKATKMLKASGFKLFNDITDKHVSGVVKSQTDADLVYACRLAHDGQYSCCTQNLNVCGGLRGSICKHLLVLIIGLVQAGELDPSMIDAWIAKTHSVKPELDKEIMGAIFIKFKGAEAGEVDWRPTETVPEDYYAF